MRQPIVILGAGPAGLAAALKLARRNFDVTVLERGSSVGGNAGSFELGGLRVDFGSHRLHPSCDPEILSDIRSMLRDDLLTRPRNGRIRLAGRWLKFPLGPLDLIRNAPGRLLFGVSRDAFRLHHGRSPEVSFEAVLKHGLGPTICQCFYFPYARKIWGLEPSKLDAEQARRRVSASSLGKITRKIIKAMPGRRPHQGSIFYYPRNGFGQISEAFHEAALREGAKVVLDATVTALETMQGKVVGVRYGNRDRTRSGRSPARLVLSTIPLPQLARLADPAAPAEVIKAAESLRYRAMVLIYLVLETERFTEYDAHYFPSEDILITRLSEPKNYSTQRSPGTTVLCAELPCFPEDPIWAADDSALANLVTSSLASAGLPHALKINRVVTRRLSQAYPLYERGYRAHYKRLMEWAKGTDGLVTLGRQGLFAHDNTHHTLAMAYAACDAIRQSGDVDRATWETHLRRFESFVVED